MSQPLAAIGVPVFNGERWLRSTVESLLEQSFNNLEVVISDNASTDKTAEICAALCAADNRVRYVRNPENVGLFRNYDLAFHSTNSEYFKWCAVGDLCDRTFIAKSVAILEKFNDVVLVHSRTKLIGDIPDNPERYAVELNLIDDDPVVRFCDYLNKVRLNNVMNGLMRSKELKKTSLNRVFHASDKCMMAELALRGKFVEIPEDLFLRRMQADTATALMSAEATDRLFADEPVSPALLSHWKTELTLITGILKSPTSMSQRLRLFSYMSKRLVWQRRKLFEELVRYIR